MSSCSMRNSKTSVPLRTIAGACPPALRARCKGSRAKTYTNAYRAAWKTGEVVDDPEAVYLRIKNKHLMFGESREEREVRIDGEHQALVKGRLSGHQFEPLFEASVADLESVGLGKTPGSST